MEPSATHDAAAVAVPMAEQPTAATNEMRKLVQAFDWAKTSIGPMDSWPQSLKTAVDIVLDSPIPMVMLWGPAGTMIYNDAYSGFAGSRHPQLLGMPVLEAWPEAADLNTHVMKTCLAGNTLSYRDQHLVLNRTGVPEDLWTDLNYSPLRDDQGQPAGVLAIVTETTDRVLSERNLRESEDHYRHTVELNPQVTWTALPDGQIDHVAQRFSDWTGVSALGESWHLAVHPEDLEATTQCWIKAIERGQPYDAELRLKMRDGSYHWARSRAFPRRDEAGRIIKWYGTTEDVHERKVSQERQRLLVNELNHRLKNTLATFQAIVSQTIRKSATLEEANTAISARLQALSRAQNVLTRESWEGAEIEKVVRSALEPLLLNNEDDFRITGPAMRLTPRASLSLSLALHELATNAAKYGALSADSGTVAVQWKVEGTAPTFNLSWQEQGGPPVTPPSRKGFGSRLIEQGLAAELGGEVEILYQPAGVAFNFHTALREVQEGHAGGGQG